MNKTHLRPKGNEHTSTFCKPTNSLDLGAGSDDLLSHAILVLQEVLLELLAQPGGLLKVVVLTSFPDTPRVEDLAGDTRTARGNGQVEDGVVLILGLGELTTVNSIEDGTSVFQGASLAAGRLGLTGPTSINQPGVGSMLLDLLREHLRVSHGV